MENPESRVDFRKYILILRSATLAVQIIPFAYTLIYIFVLFSYGHISEEAASALDTLFYISPIQIVGLLILSKILHLCKWHRMACVLPLFPQLVSFIDYYIIALTEIEAYVTNIITIVMSALLLVSAYKVFFANGRK